MSKIFKLFSKNKKTLLLIIGVGLILFLVPIQSVKASPDVPWSDCAWFDVGCILWRAFEYIITFPLRIVIFIAVLLLSLIALGTGVLFSLITALLTWMMGAFMQVPIIYNMPMVQAGWTFCRDFANMFFILLLAFIGLSTILKLKEYESKKTLPRLIMIALLVNFSPVIVGFIIDSANLVTNFFIGNVGNLAGLASLLRGDGGITNHILTAGNLILTGPTDEFLINAPGFLIYGIALIVFFLYASWIYFLFTLIFLLRIVYLWMFTILAPIAFLSYVLPPNKWAKKIFPSILHWDEWWERLIQWAIVGIPMGFFLYLANYLLGLDIETIFPVSELGGLEQSFIDLVTKTLGPTVALLLLHRGYKISKEAMPEAAKGIIEGVKKVGAFATATGIAAATTGAGAGATAGLLGKAAAGAKKLEGFVGKTPIIGKALKYGIAKPISWATRGVEIAAAPSLLKYAAKTRRIEMPSEFEKMSSAGQEQFVRAHALTPEAKVQYGYKMADLGTLDKTDEGFQKDIFENAKGLADSPYYKKEVAKIMDFLPDKITQKMAIDFEVGDEAKDKMKDKIIEMVRELRTELSGDEITIGAGIKYEYITKEDVERDRAAAIARANARLTPIQETRFLEDTAAAKIHADTLKSADWAKISKASIKSLPLQLSSRNASSSHLRTLQNSFDNETVGAVLNKGRGLNTITEAELCKIYNKNPGLVRWAFINPAGKEMLNWAKNFPTWVEGVPPPGTCPP